MTVTILPNLPAFKSFSMDRYRRELLKAIAEISDEQLQVQEFPFSRYAFLGQGLTSPLIERWLVRTDRWITYPLNLRRFGPGCFHILDQSHAHLALAAKSSKVIVTCHDLISFRAARKEFPVDTKSFNENMLKRLLAGLRKADRIIAISETTKDDLQNLAGIPPEKIDVVYYGKGRNFRPVGGPELALERTQIRSQLQLPNDAQIILHVGISTFYKNTGAIISALGELAADSSCKNIFFVRVGSDFTEREKNLAQEIGVDTRLLWAGGTTDDEELARFYRAADVLAFPSHWEGFGWPPLEAMSCGLPVVCSNIPSLTEVVGQAALRVDPQDYRNLAINIRLLLENRQLRENLVHAGYVQAGTFEWEKMAAHTYQIYKQVFGDRTT